MVRWLDRVADQHIRDELSAFAAEPGAEIVRLANKLGVKVFAELLFESGYLEFAPSCGSESGFRIVVNESDPPERQRFTVAHELAHFLLHRSGDAECSSVRQERMHRDADQFTYMISVNSDAHRNEREADQFARRLLMSEPTISSLLKAGVTDAGALARRFGVSPAAMLVRLQEIGRLE